LARKSPYASPGAAGVAAAAGRSATWARSAERAASALAKGTRSPAFPARSSPPTSTTCRGWTWGARAAEVAPSAAAAAGLGCATTAPAPAPGTALRPGDPQYHGPGCAHRT